MELFEAGHGKGVSIAVGGAMKRAADRKLKYGGDITCAQIVWNIIKTEGSETDAFEVNESDIILHQESLDRIDLKAVKGTMKLHQICSHRIGVILHRDISCTCKQTAECHDHQLSKSAVGVLDVPTNTNILEKRATSASRQT